jgi:hypothetical protein
MHYEPLQRLRDHKSQTTETMLEQEGNTPPRCTKSPRHSDDRDIVIGFEQVPGEPPAEAYLTQTYCESGMIVMTTKKDPSSELSGLLGLDTIFFPNPGIQSVSQAPGNRVALPEDKEDDIVIRRKDGEKFGFTGGYFSFTNAFIRLTAATLSFEGYRKGKLVSSFSAEIVEQGGFINVPMTKEIDTLIIKDNDPTGWAYMDNLTFTT